MRKLKNILNIKNITLHFHPILKKIGLTFLLSVLLYISLSFPVRILLYAAGLEKYLFVFAGIYAIIYIAVIKFSKGENLPSYLTLFFASTCAIFIAGILYIYKNDIQELTLQLMLIFGFSIEEVLTVSGTPKYVYKSDFPKILNDYPPRGPDSTRPEKISEDIRGNLGNSNIDEANTKEKNKVLDTPNQTNTGENKASSSQNYNTSNVGNTSTSNPSRWEHYSNLEQFSNWKLDVSNNYTLGSSMLSKAKAMGEFREPDPRKQVSITIRELGITRWKANHNGKRAYDMLIEVFPETDPVGKSLRIPNLDRIVWSRFEESRYPGSTIINAVKFHRNDT